MPSLTKRFVDSIDPKQVGKDVTYWDDSLTGFGLRVRKGGSMTWLVMYRTREGRLRKLTIGRANRLAPDAAYDLAKDKLADVTKGSDPATEKTEARKALTVSELADLYLVEGPGEKANKKASSWATDRSNITRHVVPLLGRKIAKTLTAADVARFQSDVAVGKSAADIKTKKQGRAIVEGGKGTAARSLAVLASMLQFGVSRGVLTTNPAKGVKPFKGEPKKRFLSGAEVARLADTLTAMEAEGLNRNAATAIRLLMLTGCRKDEILSLRWEHVDFERHCLRLPDSKTGAKVVPMAAAAMELLSKSPRKAKTPWVLPAAPARGAADTASAKPIIEAAGHYTGLQKAWERVRERAAVAAAEAEHETPAGQLVAKLRQEKARKLAAEAKANPKANEKQPPKATGKDETLPSFAECVAAAKAEGWEFPTGLADLRLHDLRHSFASFAVADGSSLYMVGKILGHKQSRTTEVYAHLADDPVRAVADRAANKINAAMNGGKGNNGEGAEVIDLPNRRA